MSQNNSLRKTLLHSALNFLKGRKNRSSHAPYALDRRKIDHTTKEQLKEREKKIQKTETTWKIKPYKVYEYTDTQSFLKNITILHLSDLHFNKKTEESLSQYLESLAKEKEYDLVVITGDIIHKHHTELSKRALNALQTISQKAQASFFVLGNHDFTEFDASSQKHLGPSYIREKLGSIGYNYLLGASQDVTIKGQKITISGIGDSIYQYSLSNKNIEHKKNFHLLILHNLDAMSQALRDIEFDLILSGHTHAGEQRIIGPINGYTILRYTQENGQPTFTNCNQQIFMPWKALTKKTLSYISPGLNYRMGKRMRTYQPGATFIHLE